MERVLKGIVLPTPTFEGQRAERTHALQERLYDALSAFKIRTAMVAMHLDREWRSRLFDQLDELLELDSWEAEDLPPSAGSISTFIRLLVFLKPARRPGLAATADGNLIATWDSNNDQLTIECLAQDAIRWSVSMTVDGQRERAAGMTHVPRVQHILAPYPTDRWFALADRQHPG